MKRRLALLGCLLASTLRTTRAASDPVQGRPRRLVVPYTAGGGSDLFARALAQRLSDALGEPVIVDNRPGAGGYIAADYVAKSPADGYTLLVGGNALMLGPMLYASHKLSPLKDFTPIASLIRVTLVLVSAANFPASNLRDLVRMARADKTGLSYASTSPGIMMTTEQIKSLAGIEMLRVPYRGAPEGLIDVSANRVSVMFDSVAVQQTQIKAGRVKGLAVNSESRHPLLPQVPTLAESGVEGYEEDNYIAALGPANMERAEVDKLNAAFQKILQAPDFRKFLESNGFVASPSSPQALAGMLNATTGRFRRIVDQLGLKPE